MRPREEKRDCLNEAGGKAWASALPFTRFSFLVRTETLLGSSLKVEQEKSWRDRAAHADLGLPWGQLTLESEEGDVLNLP